MSSNRRQGVTEAALVLAFYTVVAIVATWPLTIKPFSGFYGFGNDNLGGASIYGWVHKAAFGSGSVTFNPNLQAPFGYDVPVHALQPMDWAFSLVFGGIKGGLFVQSAEIFLSFVLAGACMYLLVRHLTHNRPAALVAGFLFTFSPFHLMFGQQYGALASIQWIPLYALAIVRLFERPTLRRAVAAGASLALIGLTSFYYLWFTGWATLLVLLVLAIPVAVRYMRRRDEGRWADLRASLRVVVSRGALAGFTFVALFLPFALATLSTLSTSEKAAAAHPISEAVRYSARPWMFLVPPVDNPLLGRVWRDWVPYHLFDAPVYEQTFYLGIVTVLLLLCALWPARRQRSRYRLPLIVLALVSLALMIGPYFPLEGSYWENWAHPDTSRKIPWIGYLLFNANGTFRFFSRNFVLLSCALSALAGIGAARLFSRFRSTTAQFAVALLCILLAGAEFTNSPPERWYSADPPPWVEAVRGLEPGAIVDYPLAPENSPRSLYYLFWQTQHRHPTVNPAGTPEAQWFATQIAHPDWWATGAALRDAGIKYVVIHTRLPMATTMPYQPGWPDDSLPASTAASNPWFEHVTTTRDAVIYSVRDSPRR
jgi:hypothetical protein